MKNILELLRQEPQLITTWYPSPEVLLQHIYTGELVVCLSAAGLYLGIYQTQLDPGCTTSTRVTFSGYCWLEQAAYACRVEMLPELRRGHVWLSESETR